MKEHYIGLVMIVKNESHIIEEALTSVLPFIDTYVISDTGSTDDTKEKIIHFFKKHNIPGNLCVDEWVDFGTNRTKVLQHASKHMKYAFMLDADDILILPKQFEKKQFQQQLQKEYPDGYRIKMVNENDTLQYYRTQIFHTKRRWRYEGVLHEFPCLSNQKTPKLLDLPFKVMSRRLGSRNQEDRIVKYTKDAEILLKILQKEPTNTRYQFYLAQSYRDADMFEDAIRWYKIRSDFGGWYEEVYYSLYQIGSIYLEKLNKVKEGLQFCLKAFAYHPKRIESMHTLANYYCYKYKDYSTAFHFIKKIKDTPLPLQDGLFVTEHLYQYLVLFIYHLLTFLTFRKLDIKDDDWSRLPDETHTPLRDCLLLENIPVLSEICPTEMLPFPTNSIPLNKKDDSKYRTLNPCIARHSDGNIWYNIRCTNFDIHYKSMDDDGKIHTFNFLCDENFGRVYKLIDKSVFRSKVCSKKATIIGYEDVRIFWYKNRWWFVANNDEIPSSIDTPQMVLGCLEECGNDIDMTWGIEKVVHLQFPYQNKTEKNWCPILDGCDNIRLVYSIHPFIILEPDIHTGFCKVLYNLDYKYQLTNIPSRNSSLRGSTPWISFKDGILGIAHHVYFLEHMNYQRIYYHVFMYIRNDYTEIKLSEPFHFEKHLIEFATGIQMKGEDVIITYSVSDEIPKQMKISSERIWSMLSKI